MYQGVGQGLNAASLSTVAYGGDMASYPTAGIQVMKGHRNIAYRSETIDLEGPGPVMPKEQTFWQVIKTNLGFEE
jgi:hypothetical protein